MANVEQLFHGFRTQLDEYHSQRERVIKASRDITASSKKVIFALQRQRNVDDQEALANDPQVVKHFKDIHERIASVKDDVTGELNQWRYHKQFTGCIQEYIEAISFQYYLQHRRVISYEQVALKLPEILITRGDYILGIMDLTGELMRYAIAHLSDNTKDSKRGASTIATQISNTLRELKSEIEGLDIPAVEKALRIREFAKKVDVFESSLQKVEQAMYSLLIRGVEANALCT